ncbi:hypothetical protein Ptr902_03064 [Pyrenophora tritici-repentis]|nr:hypothetical protein Alg130_07205 [Pyrenophora tritici-repentis]KAI0608550.1 hypothetical protein TUN205_07214 [Pyrenophora tritici-repentis]KAI0626007.1 hypothetical protein TUN199_02007 [Pyrenophora tritici-repentis]KAI2484124.1 hypothetical protein Ptr902_03064 [Pyrenophora tritici-repentis]
MGKEKLMHEQFEKLVSLFISMFIVLARTQWKEPHVCLSPANGDISPPCYPDDPSNAMAVQGVEWPVL